MTKRPFRPVIKVYVKNCSFCENKTTPDYKEVSVLNHFVTERGKLLARSRTGLCSKHQRLLTRAIKLSRLIAMMPFVVRA